MTSQTRAQPCTTMPRPENLPSQPSGSPSIWGQATALFEQNVRPVTDFLTRDYDGYVRHHHLRLNGKSRVLDAKSRKQLTELRLRHRVWRRDYPA